MPDEKNRALQRPTPTKRKKIGTNYLVGIGINAYEHCVKLNNAVRDVKAFIELMQTKFEFEAKNTRNLYDEKATRRNILKLFRNLATSVNSNDTLVIYYAGHGDFIKELNQGYWVPIEAEKDEPADYIANSEIIDVLNAIKSKHTFLISDACFSGSLFSSVSRVIKKETRDDVPSRWCLTSGRKEIVTDGPAGEISPFAESVLTVLNRTTQQIGVSEFCVEVERLARLKAPKQTPVHGRLEVKGGDLGQLVLYLKANEISDWEEAETKNTVKSYEYYKMLHPQGQYVGIANKRLVVLYEEKDWQIAKTRHTLYNYFEYRKKYPNGLYVAEATQAISELEEAKDWKKAIQRNTLSGYDDFLRKHPNSQYSGAAKQRQQRILDIEREEENRKIATQERVENNAWKQATQLNTIRSYEKYLKEYPNGRYINVAKQKIKDLQPIIVGENLEEDKESKNKVNKVRLLVGFIVVTVLVIGIRNAFLQRENSDLSEKIVDTSKVTTKSAVNPDTLISVVDDKGETANDYTFNYEMVSIPSGTFTMGDNNSKYDDEKPEHRVTVKDFQIGKYEVTQAQWKQIMGNNPSYHENCDGCPVENVSWNDIQEFIKKLNAKTGKKYRLPTEAEWEYTARGGENYKYAGSNDIDKVGWYSKNSDDKTHPVGQKSPNGYGLYDMSGNVWEWCQDHWHSNDTNAPTDGSAWIDGSADDSHYRVLRGGSYFNYALNCRTSSRLSYRPSYQDYSVGFRLVFQFNKK